METCRPSGNDAQLERLRWDTAHFGIPVAQIPSPSLTDEELDKVLGKAQAQGIELVYWRAPAERDVPRALLRSREGRLVDRRATFRGRLADLSALEHLSACADVAIREEPLGPASEALQQLAVEAGTFSRFGVDPHIPREKFEALYRQWMERSTRRELAEAVLVAYRPEEPNVPLGMVTLALSRGEGVTGLIAVHKAARGRGIGSRLLAADHDVRRQRGVSEMSVATQLANESACRLYRDAGYRLAEVNNVYHFWPQRAEVTTRDAAAA